MGVSIINNDNILVAINCFTYNQEPYIRECLEGFVMQKTNFKFVAIVHDDASTDRTADIIREYEAKYPDIIKPIYETENQYSKNDGSLGRIMEAAIDATGAKYVALCEGDDYWTDPYKLQKQVDFLEGHGEYSICCHRLLFYFEDICQFKPKFEHNKFNEDEIVTFTNYENLRNWFTETSSVMYRSNVANDDYRKKYKYSRDAHFCYHILKKGKGAYLPFVGSVYRKHSGGVYTSMSISKTQYISYKIYKELMENNPDDSIIYDFFIESRAKNLNDIRYLVRNGKLDDYNRKLMHSIINDSFHIDGVYAAFKNIWKIMKSKYLKS